MSEGGVSDGVGNGHGQVRAVIGHMYRHGVAAVQIDAGRSQVDRRRRRCLAGSVNSGRVVAFSVVVVEVEFNRDAIRNSLPAQPRSHSPEGRNASWGILDYES